MEILTKDIQMSEDTAVAIGNFDGVHTAHKKLIQKAVENKGLKSVVFTFFPHTQSVFGKKLERLITEKEKWAQLQAQNPDFLYVQSADREFLNKTPYEFAQKILKQKLRAKAVYVGYNFRFGKGGKGTPDTLKELGDELGFEVFVMPEYKICDKSVSSSNIRQALYDGNIEDANKMLGRPFSVSGEVVQGKKLGKKLGFPTANLEPDDGLMMPKRGVYVTKTCWNGHVFDSITNVGYNPTVECGQRTKVETHIPDISKELYGEQITVMFYGFLRGEQKFSSVEQLKEQIQKDEQDAKKYLTK